jgi:hypothetical protein
MSRMTQSQPLPFPSLPSYGFMAEARIADFHREALDQRVLDEAQAARPRRQSLLSLRRLVSLARRAPRAEWLESAPVASRARAAAR